ncbi:MAG: VTT domain-containing protein [Candidatus Vogelbacteria bacterium]|nr:VTT domain-containing protein [Candidatus Vogelbacteria bacterium]
MFDWLDPLFLIQTLGLLGVISIIFAESCLFFGFFLPGDSLLFTAGFLASQGHFNIVVLILGCAIASILGDNVGYWFGSKVGPKIFTREDSFFFRKSHIQKTQEFYDRYGAKTVMLARFVPVVRTFAPILAGVGSMNYKTFFYYNVVGGVLWSVSFISLGYFLGSLIPGVDEYITIIIFIIIGLSLMPAAYELLKGYRRSQSKHLS